ncbi:PH domain-containing protein [Plantactinospora sp. KLBMP9567]|uniref:PH domain-containing protein n=1 Tax=Plantactinospora sp. KLBMP9567 TaxID=3085900 RepID=UPI0029827E74|nr:PH domain-containing protein [Plantactinospora sp. KLBMP9567]MDW5325588.1 PH domain-containing protein [Plantactinospora sp. KLBMP9567]
MQVWRLGLGLRICAGLVIGGMAAGVMVFLAYEAAAPEGDLRAPLAVAVPFGVLGLSMWQQTFRPRTSVGPQGVVLRSKWRTIRLPWSMIVRCDPGYDGITITCADGSRVVAPAPQKSNLSRWLGRKTRADEVAAYLERRAHEHRRLIQPTPGE